MNIAIHSGFLVVDVFNVAAENRGLPMIAVSFVAGKKEFPTHPVNGQNIAVSREKIPDGIFTVKDYHDLVRAFLHYQAGIWRDFRAHSGLLKKFAIRRVKGHLPITDAASG